MDNIKLTAPDAGRKYIETSSENAANGWLRSSNKFQHIIFYPGESFPRADLAVWMIPVFTISIFLTVVLKYDLLLISGLLFCWLIFDFAKPKLEETFRVDNDKIFGVAITVTIAS